MKFAKVGWFVLLFSSAILSFSGMATAESSTKSTLAQTAVQAESVIDINQASAEQIADALKGVGLSKAQAIVAYREVHGPFVKAEELIKVKGIGQSTVAKNIQRIQINLQ